MLAIRNRTAGRMLYEASFLGALYVATFPLAGHKPTKYTSIQSFAFIWFDKGNQNEFLKHPKIKWLDGGHEPQPLVCRSIALLLELI